VIEINHDNASVNRMGTCPFQPKATIAVATRPLQIAITPDGSTALVTSFDNAVNFIDLNSNRVTFTLQTGSSINPNGIAITSDGKTAYITSFAPSGAVVAKIDLGSRSIVSTLLVDAYPQNLVLSPDDSQLFVTFPYENEVGIIDTFTFTMAYSFTVPAPRGIAFNSKGTKAYIASAGNPDNATAGTLVEFNTNNFQIANRYNVGLGPNDVAVLYGDQFVATSNYEGQSISKIDTVSGTVQTVNVNGRPSGISIVH
jgi:DNA-binding beta-propeller fold protein YncE